MNPTPTHHPSEPMLLRCAAGRLPFGQALVVATHLPFCPECQANIRLAETVGGALLASLPPTDLTADALTRTLARLEMPETAPPAMESVALAAGVPLPAALRGMVRPAWRWIAPGLSRITIDPPPGVTDQRICLLRVGPGRRLPDHRHHGWEVACVLAGSFTDVTGEYRQGDMAELEGEARHQPIAGMGEECICLLAWEGRLRLKGLARLIQPLMGV